MQASLINKGCDLHLHHGPIDLIINAKGDKRSVKDAYHIARHRFSSILDGLVVELETLRQPVSECCNVSNPVALRMWQATSPYRKNHFITPMAAVAGSVADEVLQAMTAVTEGLISISVNNGGDIAVWLSAGQHTTVGVADPLSGDILARAMLSAGNGIGGIATSGRHGRSLSGGIADSVTVLASNAAAADAAATLIANAVDLADNPKVQRVPAIELDPDSDLGHFNVTVELDRLTRVESTIALGYGLKMAEKLVQDNLIRATFLLLQGSTASTASFKTLAHTTKANQRRMPKCLK